MKQAVNRLLVGVVLAAGAYLGLWFLFTPEFVKRLDNISSNPNPMIRHFSPTWRSIKKVVDLPYLVRATNHQSSLPIYSIALSSADQIELLLNLPDYPQEYKLLEDFKKTVIGGFQHGPYSTDRAEIRYRGVSPNHWNALKKSLQVNLPADAPLDGHTTYRFFIGEDKGWVKAMLWNHIAEKLGTMTLEAKPVRLIVNGKDAGVYILIEGWEPTLIKRYGKPAGAIFSNKNIETDITDLWRSDQIAQWYNRNEPDVLPQSYPELVELLRIVSAISDEEFVREIPGILDMDSFYRWSIATVLSGNFHQGNIANMNFYFNPVTRKFEPILFDATPSVLEGAVDVSNHRVVNRMLQNETFKKEFESRLAAYISDDANLTDDLAFYDQWTESLKLDIFADTAKVQTSIEAMRFIQYDRANYKHNYLTLQKMLRENGRLSYTFAKETYPLSDSAN